MSIEKELVAPMMIDIPIDDESSKHLCAMAEYRLKRDDLDENERVSIEDFLYSIRGWMEYGIW